MKDGQTKSVQSVIEEVIAPDIAQEYLETMKENRRVSQTVVERYAAQMRRGQWTPLASVVQFDKEGSLVNGQHRMLAIIESGEPQQFIVRRGGFSRSRSRSGPSVYPSAFP